MQVQFAHCIGAEGIDCFAVATPFGEALEKVRVLFGGGGTKKRVALIDVEGRGDAGESGGEALKLRDECFLLRKCIGFKLREGRTLNVFSPLRCFPRRLMRDLVMPAILFLFDEERVVLLDDFVAIV